MCEENSARLVFGVLCLAGIASAVISNGGARPDIKTPTRRFYIYNADIIPHAAAALGMMVPHTFYNPPQYAPYPHYQHYSEEVEEEVEEHEDKVPNPVQLLSFFQQKQKQKPQKKRKVKKKNRNKTVKKVKKTPKKCMPFRLRIIKKSDLSSPFYSNIRGQLPYGYGDEYFPQSSTPQDLALISLNTSSLSSNGSGFPQTLSFVYPRYPSPARYRAAPPRKKIYRFAKPRKRVIRPFNVKRKPWTQVNSWRFAPPGKTVSDFPLEEPIPGDVGGSPPSSPLFNTYKDNRIPLSYPDEQKVEDHALIASTPSYVTDEYQEYWNNPAQSEVTTSNYGTKYSDPDYYRYGTYSQSQPQKTNQQEAFHIRGSSTYQVVQNAHHNTTRVPSYGQNYYISPEKVVTVTPTPVWVPVPQSYKVSRPSNEDDNQPAGNVRVHYIQHMSGGFKNLSAKVENASQSYSFGDKITPKPNCTSNCPSATNTYPQSGAKLKRRNKYHSTRHDLKNNQINLGTTTNKYTMESLQIKRVGAKDVVVKARKEYRLGSAVKRSRSYHSNHLDIVTAKYPEDTIDGLHASLANSSSVRARRSEDGGLSAVVSGSILVREA